VTLSALRLVLRVCCHFVFTRSNFCWPSCTEGFFSAVLPVFTKLICPHIFVQLLVRRLCRSTRFDFFFLLLASVPSQCVSVVFCPARSALGNNGSHRPILIFAVRASWITSKSALCLSSCLSPSEYRSF
jgi:hypothetical protein